MEHAAQQLLDDSFDLQVNGYGGVDFNRDGLTTSELESACALLEKDGCSEFLPTIITDDVDRMVARIAAIGNAVQESPQAARMVRGIHVEGPFLNPSDGTAGAHPRESIRPANLDVMKKLFDSAGGLLRLVTLAPECDAGFEVIRFLTDRGIVVSAGHCDPTWDQLSQSIDCGLTMFTHVGNGCSLLQNRHDNIVQRVLSLSDRLWCCWIADGVHIPPFALGNYLKAAGIERCIVVTDAMTAAGLGPGTYSLGSQSVVVDEQLRAMLPGSDGRLAGSVATPVHLQSVLYQEVGISAKDIWRMMSENPRKALSLPTKSTSR